MSQLKKYISVKCINFNTASRSRSISNSQKKTVTERVRSISKETPKVLKLPLKIQTPNKGAVSKLGKIKIDLGNKTTSRSNLSTKVEKPRSISQIENYPRILPDFGRLETELLDCNQFTLQLPDIAFPTTEDISQERIILANRISHTIKTKKKIPPTSPDFYKLCYVIGRGAFAKVCLGVQILTGAKVAMKIIEKASIKTESAKKRLIQEITIMKTLSVYRTSLQLYEVFETKKQIYIIMEYIEGGDLMKFTKDKALPESQVKVIFAQVVLALQMLQNHNILHRDIKLDNVLLSDQQIKLCDYGVSRQIIKGQKILEQCGTPAYLAPEIISCKTGYEGYASDIWSSGVLLYMLLIGKVPFKGTSMNELNQHIQNGLLNFMEMKKANISNEAVDLIKCMLTTNPKLRISLQEIINHPWLKDIQLKQNKILQQNNLDLRVINQIEQFGYQREFILKSLQKQTLCHISALYSTLTPSFFSKRKQHLKFIETEEAKDLQAKYEQIDVKHSLLKDLYKLLKWKMLGIATLIGTGVGLFQIWETMDYIDQHLVPLKLIYEVQLADSTIDIINAEEEFMVDGQLQKRVQNKLLLLDRDYPIFQLFPNGVLLSSRIFFESLSDQELQALLKCSDHHLSNRTNCRNLNLKYALSLTYYRLLRFPKYVTHYTFKQSVLAKQYFFLRVNENQEYHDEILTNLIEKWKTLEQGKYSFVLQHPYI